MSDIGSYSTKEREAYWYSKWSDLRLYHSEPDDREPFTVVIPPPNVTGVLHMGHTLNNTIQDILVRRARMQGYNACWVPGTDHASIATEAKVTNLLREQGIDKHELGRKKFLDHAFEWKEKYGGIIVSQFKKLGISADWDRLAFTMDETRYEAVIDVFNRLYEKGLIYRGERMINWDPKAKTALSDEEVIHREATDKLYYVNYRISDSDEVVCIATTRPETIMADTALCVHPEDERFSHLHGKKAIVPLVEREIPIITDDYVDLEFGTGCLKITPAHDVNDFEIGKRHKLDIINILHEDGSLNEEAQFFVGMDREAARVAAAEELEKKGALIKTEAITHNVGTSERTGVVIEPRLSTQWWCDMGKMAPEALEVVEKNEVQFHPSKFKNTYRHWMENIRDWCISRQLWWGHRIPAWYLPDNRFVVAHNVEEAIEKARQLESTLSAEDLRQDEDVLDTWFSSWLWPISVFDGVANPDNEEINYYYPTEVLVTAPDIIFFWVARMIMCGLEYRDTIPFRHVYFTGMVRDEQGRKMSKQLGNSPDLLKLIDEFGADGVRFGILVSSPAGNDLLFDQKLCSQGSNFINKIWNALKLIKSWKGFDKIQKDVPENIANKNQQASELFGARLAEAIQKMEKAYTHFKVSEALQEVYRLIWNDFCSNYLEWIKPTKETVIDETSYEQCLSYFETCLKLLHPIMPFITEEIYHQLRPRKEGESISTSEYPVVTADGHARLAHYYQLDQLATDSRNYKVKNQIPLRDQLKVGVLSKEADLFERYETITMAAAGLESIEMISEKVEGKQSFLSGTNELFDLGNEFSLSEEEIERLQEEVKRLKGFLQGIEKKLSNERFVSGAPAAVVEKEKKKQADTLSKIKTIETKLSGH